MHATTTAVHPHRISFQAVVLLGLLAGAFLGGFLLGTRQDRVGYRVQRFEDDLGVWETIPVLDAFTLHGSPKHPAVFRLWLDAPPGSLLAVEVLNASGITLYVQEGVPAVAYELQLTGTQQLFLTWLVLGTGTCGFSCRVHYVVELWEWEQLVPTVQEGRA